MKYMMITGASKGLGEAIALEALKGEWNVIALSRNENGKLKDQALSSGKDFRFYPVDLTNELEAEETWESVYQDLPDVISELVVVNNAGTVQPIDTVEHLISSEVNKALQLNIQAPMIASKHAVMFAKSTKVTTTVVNISSGAATRGIHGWSVYGATKAALNYFTEVLNMEVLEQGLPLKAMAFNPGIMDTDMQGEIRSSSKQAFKEVEKFQQFKEENALRSPYDVAKVVLTLLNHREEYDNGKMLDVNDFLS